jgi:hypothetical protein
LEFGAKPIDGARMLPGFASLLPSLLLTVIGAYDTAGLVRASDVVVQGRVVETRSRWNEAHTRILTEVQVRVDDPWKGAPPKVVTVRQLGGTVDGVGMRVVGEPVLAPADEVVLFLARIPLAARAAPPVYRMVGMAQGRLRVVRAAGEPAKVVSAADGLEIQGKPLPNVQRLDALRSQVQSLVAR